MSRKASSGEAATSVPGSIEAEQALLGAVMLDNKMFQQVRSIVDAADFFEPIHAKIYQSCIDLQEQKKPATPVTLAKYMPDVSIGQLTISEYLAQLCAGAVTITNAPDFAREVRDMAIRRKVLEIAVVLEEELRRPDSSKSTSELIGEVQSSLYAVVTDRQSDVELVMVDSEIERMSSNGGGRHRGLIELPLPQLSDVMSGQLEAGNLYGMLSGSGEGKTSMVLQIMRHAAENGHPALMLSYDQQWTPCLNQMVSQKIGIEHSRLKDPSALTKAEQEKYWETVYDLGKLHMAHVKCSGRFHGSAHILNFAGRFLSKIADKTDKVPLIILDHVRKVRPKNDRDHEGRIAAEVNGACRDFADNYGAVWLSLNQRSTSGARRKNPRPIDVDIFGGEMAREDYDGVFYLYRPWKYWQSQLATAANSREETEVNDRFVKGGWTENLAEVGALKVRYGDPTIRRRLRFEAQFTRYESLRDEQLPDLGL